METGGPDSGARWSGVDPGFHEAVASLSTDLDWEVKLGVIRTLGATLAIAPSGVHAASGRMPCMTHPFRSATPCWAVFFGLSGDVVLLQATTDCGHA